MNTIVKNSLEKSMSYQSFRTLVSDLLAKGKSTGENQTEALFNYSKLNNSRMKRLDKTFHLSKQAHESLQYLDRNITFIVLTESWCGDAAHSLPIIQKIAENSKNIELKVALRDENIPLMNQFLTGGAMAIPKLVAIDTDTHKIIGNWGSRPSEATKMVNDYKEEHGSLDADFKKDLQVWYNKNKGINIQNDILELLGLGKLA